MQSAAQGPPETNLPSPPMMGPSGTPRVGESAGAALSVFGPASAGASTGAGGPSLPVPPARLRRRLLPRPHRHACRSPPPPPAPPAPLAPPAPAVEASGGRGLDELSQANARAANPNSGNNDRSCLFMPPAPGKPRAPCEVRAVARSRPHPPLEFADALSRFWRHLHHPILEIQPSKNYPKIKSARTPRIFPAIFSNSPPRSNCRRSNPVGATRLASGTALGVAA